MKGTRSLCGRLPLMAALALLGIAFFVTPGLAFTVVEDWKVNYTDPGAVSVDPADGSCLFTSAGSVVRLADDGSLAWEVTGTFFNASVNPGDGSCWASDETTGQLTHLAADGTPLWQGGSYDFSNAESWRQLIDVDPVDGSVWLGEQSWLDPTPGRLIHLSAGGAELWATTDYMFPVYGVSANPNDGSCWVSTTFWFLGHEIRHYAADGTPLFADLAYRAWAISVDEGDDSVWHTTGMSPVGPGDVVHRAEDGSEIWRADFVDPQAVAVNPRDGSCWVSDGVEIIYLASDGTELWRGVYGSPFWAGGGASIAVDPRDGSCRVGDWGHGYVVRLNVVAFPQAAFAAIPTAGPAPLTLPFEDWSLGMPTSWLWDFGDGGASTERNPTHTYTSPGTYPVTLTVSNGYGTDTMTYCITVLPPQCATRTPGYWFTHPAAVIEAFSALANNNASISNSGGLIILCTDDGCAVTPEDAMAIFWQAHGLRATFAQHILAAIFNNALLKPAPAGIIDAALAVLCNPASTNDEISAAMAPLVAYNEGGTQLPMVGYQFGYANLRAARLMASGGSVPACVAPTNGLRRSSRLPKR
jgi:PKD repeat protein